MRPVKEELGWAKSRTEFRVQNKSSMGSRRILKHWWLWMQVVVMVVLVLASEIGVHGQDIGTWQIVVANAGIASMHTAVTSYNTVVLLDRTNIGASQILLPSKLLALPNLHLCNLQGVLHSSILLTHLAAMESIYVSALNAEVANF